MDATTKGMPVEPWNQHKGPMPFAPGVQREEYLWGDIYTGRVDAMVAAGLVRPDRIPGAPGMNKFTLAISPDGQVVPRGKRNPGGAGAKRISWRGRSLSVSVDGSKAVCDARRAGCDMYIRDKEAQGLARLPLEEKRRMWDENHMQRNPAECLRSMPKSAADFRRALLQDLRSHLHFRMDRATRASARHGFTLSAEAAEGVALAFDAVSEALLSADVEFDARRQADIVHRLQTYIVQAGGGAPRQVAEVIMPNPALLLGEAS